MGRRRQALKIAFLDSSVLFTAVNSPSGGSAKLFTLKSLKLVASTLVLTEVEKNVREKLQSHHLERFFILVDKLQIDNRVPTYIQIKTAQKVTAKKDAPILASFLISKVEVLVTLNKKHFFIESVEGFLKPSIVVTPKMLIENFGLG